MKSSLILIKLNNWGKDPPTIKMEGKFDKYTLGEQKYTSTNAKGQSSDNSIIFTALLSTESRPQSRARASEANYSHPYIQMLVKI